MAKRLKGLKILITAGPTRERWDAVRFLSNYSSGRMGYALAAAANKRGAGVTLISGPVKLAPPAGVKLVEVESARDMKREVFRRLRGARALLMAAAVADFRPRTPVRSKLKKGSLPKLALERNPDILEACGRKKGGRYLLGFAAESSRLLKRAREKLRKKNLDCVVANYVSGSRNGAMGSRSTQLTVIFSDDRTIRLRRMSKERAAERLIQEVAVDMKKKGYL